MDLTRDEVQKAFQEAVNDYNYETFEGMAKRLNVLIQEKLRRYTVNGFEPRDGN